MDKQDLLGTFIVLLIALSMFWLFTTINFKSGNIGKAFGDFICGDGDCDFGEESDCPEDCPFVCGDGTCNSDQENADNCPEDCSLICGNGIIEKNATYVGLDEEEYSYDEMCEGEDLDGKTCADFGFSNGTLSCDPEFCVFNTDLCYNTTVLNYNDNQSICNNSICDINESMSTCPSDCECNIGETRNCSSNIGICRSGVQVCINASRWGLCIGGTLPAKEVCDTLDNDCDGTADEGVDADSNGAISDSESFDQDDDGYFPLSGIIINRINNTNIRYNCSGYEEYDCDDTKKNVNPGAEEDFNDRDDDCDGLTDEGINQSYQSYGIERIDLGIIKKEGSKTYLRQADWATFKINGIFGKIEVKDISFLGAVLMVFKVEGMDITPLPEIPVSIGQSKEFDLNGDSKNDISITLDNVQNKFKTYLTIKDISQPLATVQQCNNNMVCDPGETTENCAADCIVPVNCNNNGVCDISESVGSCPNDCAQQQEQQPVQQVLSPGIEFSCNDNGICEAWENQDNCPNDCKEKLSKNNFKYILSGVIATLLLLTIASSSVVISKSNPYKINKNLKQNVIKAIDLGYNLNAIQNYLLSQHVDEITLRKSLRYAADFMSLRQAIVFYLAQGHVEQEVKSICLKNKWPKGITNEVFEEIYAQQKRIAGGIRRRL